ncbi:FmdB family transcriptional regulator [candidate division LCP-89 bacterium B3_LCP]|uniref:FmdB family transcriptional regulator n=1 Tax=candidate division LCP-89 bacterium B3_LCP TaxID=2012998 RepID=A0A532V3F1_UNCL8|nr:MAG: FmdB family transcriptional regulator [candidate division LCP-89 bacterium B3_LCP]
MPTYEYRCNDCGFEFEEFQSMVAEPLHVCPRCRGDVRRLISGGGGLIFKGSGFYETDYKRRHFSEGSTSKPKPSETPTSETTSKESVKSSVENK